MRRTRSMSNRRESGVDPPPRRVTRSMSHSIVDPPPRRTARSMSSSTHKRKYPLMPLPDLRRPLSSCKETSALLKQQCRDVREYIKGRQKEGHRPCIIMDFSQTRCYEATQPKHTLDTEMEAAFELGVIWPDGPPKLRNKNFFRAAVDARHKTTAHVIEVVCQNIKLPQRSLISLLFVSRRIYNALISFCSGIRIWRFLDFEEMNKAGDRLVAALSMERYHHVVEDINLELAQDIEDKHLKLLRTTCGSSVGWLVSLNLNGCQNISDSGIEDITSICPRLERFSIKGNLRVTDLSIESLAKNCKFITALNLTGCQNITDDSLVTIGNVYHVLESLVITRCDHVTDAGVIAVAVGCTQLKFLSLFGIPGVTDRCLETLSEISADTLTSLDVDCCIGIERQSQEELLRLFPNLQCPCDSPSPTLSVQSESE
ncbi:hypothetical protein Leryth_020703 [Lithospermum erythrorhizon]|nr:hypothetical protein Leryth_020703 [Lithospermum erythrorhizon]